MVHLLACFAVDTVCKAIVVDTIQIITDQYGRCDIRLALRIAPQHVSFSDVVATASLDGCDSPALRAAHDLVNDSIACDQTCTNRLGRDRFAEPQEFSGVGI